MIVKPVVRFEHRTPVAFEVIRHADAGCDGIPGGVGLFRKGLGRDRDRTRGPRQLLLLGREAGIAVVTNAGVDGQPAHRPRVVHEHADLVHARDGQDVAVVVVLQSAEMVDRGRDAEGHRRRQAVGVLVIDLRVRRRRILARLRQIPFPRRFAQIFAAELERMAALAAVQKVGGSAVGLLAVTVDLPGVVRPIDFAERRIAPRVLRVAVRQEREEVTEVAEPRFDIQLVAQGAVPLALIDPRGVLLLPGFALVVVEIRRERQAVRLQLEPDLVVADELVVLVGLIGPLGGGVGQLGIEGLVEAEVRLRDLVLLHPIRGVKPDLVLHRGAAEVQRRIAITLHFVAAGSNAERNHLVAQVGTLQRIVVPVLIEIPAERVAAGACDELALHTRRRHFRALARRAEERFVDRSIVKVDARRARALGGVDAFHQHAHLPAQAVGGVSGLRAGTVAADVDARQLHRRRHREQRPQVAAVGNRGELLRLERLHRPGGGGVDDRRVAGHGHRFLQRRQCHLDVDVRGEAERDLDAFSPDGVEPGELVGHRIRARRHRGKPVVAVVRAHRRLLTEHRRAGRDDRHARQDGALRVDDAPLNDAGAAGAATLCCDLARRAERKNEHQHPREPLSHLAPPH